MDGNNTKIKKEIAYMISVPSRHRSRGYLLHIHIKFTFFARIFSRKKYPNLLFFSANRKAFRIIPKFTIYSRNFQPIFLKFTPVSPF